MKYLDPKADLTEINSNTQEIPTDLLNNPEIETAVEELKISGFTEAELRAYDKFWDSVSVEEPSWMTDTRKVRKKAWKKVTFFSRRARLWLMKEPQECRKAVSRVAFRDSGSNRSALCLRNS